MKSIVLLAGALITGCAVYSQKTTDVVRIEFTSLTRGGYNKQVVLTKDSVVISSREGRGGEFQTIRQKMKRSDWEQLIESLEKISLSEIPELKSPTMKRAYDGAMHSAITIVISNDASWSHSFDDEDPHENLKPLMKVINKLRR